MSLDIYVNHGYYKLSLPSWNHIIDRIVHGFLQALEYKKKITDASPKDSGFQPLMTLYLTDNTPPDEVIRAKESGIIAFKLYPAGATTNSDSGVTDWRKCLPTLKVMAEVRYLLSFFSPPISNASGLWCGLRIIFSSFSKGNKPLSLSYCQVLSMQSRFH